MNRRDQMHQAAWEYHERNPEVWTLFVRYTFELINRGFKHYGAKAVMERIRWELNRAGDDGLSTWKISNNHTAFYARWFAAAYPEHARFFRYHVQTSVFRGARRLPELGPESYQEVDPLS